MERQAFTIELDVNDIDRIAELTDILVETAEDFEVICCYTNCREAESEEV